MYDSGVSASSYISEIKSEADISTDIPDSSFLRWINAVEQFIYTEIIDERVAHETAYTSIQNNKIPLSGVTPPTECAIPSYDDVKEIYCDGEELEKSGVSAIATFPDKAVFYSDYSGNIVINPTFTPKKVKIIYTIRPALKTSQTSGNIKMPIEFLDIVGARMRGEAYKIANEDGLAAKWLADYNNQLESFKMWASERNSRYGK